MGDDGTSAIAGFGGFAKGFGKQLLENETRRQAASRNLAETLFSQAMQHPDPDVSNTKEFKSVIERGFGSDAPYVYKLIKSAEAGNPFVTGEGEAAAPGPAGPTGAPGPPGGAGGAGGAGGTPDPSAAQLIAPPAPWDTSGAAPAAGAEGAPAAPAAQPGAAPAAAPSRTKADAIAERLPPGSTYSTRHGDVKSTRTIEGDLNKNFGVTFEYYLKQPTPYKKEQKGLILGNALQAAVQHYDQAGRGNEVPQWARENVARLNAAMSGKEIDLAMNPIIEAATARAGIAPAVEKQAALAPGEVAIAGAKAGATTRAETEGLVSRELNPVLQASKAANAEAMAASTARGTATGALPFKIAEGERALGLQLIKRAMTEADKDKAATQQITTVREGLKRLRPAVKVFTKNPVQAMLGLQWFGVQFDKRSKMNPQRAAEIGMVDSFAALSPVISKIFGDVGNIAQAEREEITNRLVPRLGTMGDTDVSAQVKMDILDAMLTDIDDARKRGMSPDVIADRIRARYEGYKQGLPKGVGANPRATPPGVDPNVPVKSPPSTPSAAPAPTTPPPAAASPSSPVGGGTPAPTTGTTIPTPEQVEQARKLLESRGYSFTPPVP